MSWINQLLRKRKFKFVLLVVATISGVSYLLSQFFYFLVLNQDGKSNLVSRSSSGHSRPNVAINKIISKWNDSQHSKFIRDKDGHSISLRGTHSRDIAKYLPNARGKFVCIASKLEIDFLKINDDYCDCPLDGSDEPGTNACNNGSFYCEKSSKKFPDKIASFKVNDGVCDCCDGCDEWAEVPLLDKSENNEANGIKSTCPNRC